MKTAVTLLVTVSLVAAPLEAGSISGQVSYAGTQAGKVLVRASQLVPGNKVLALDGDGDYATTTITDLSGSELTIQFWFKGSTLQSAVRQQSGGFLVAGWNGLHILSNDGGTAGVVVGEGATDGQWHHLVLSWKQGTAGGFASYLDGRLVEKRDSVTDPIPNHNAPVFFGAFNGNGEYASGLLDEISIWRRALTTEEIQAGWRESLTGNEEGLVGYWNFDEGTGADLSPNGYTAELLNGAAVVPAENTKRTGGPFQDALLGPGPYTMVNLPAAANYQLTAFVDLNGDGQLNPDEPRAAYAGNPFDLLANKTGVDLDLGGTVTSPTLAIAIQSGNLTISWDANVTGFTLESATALRGNSWAAVEGAQGNSVTLDPTGGTRFFRLRE